MSINLSSPAIGSTGTFRATPYDAFGNPTSDASSVVIASDAPSVASVGANVPDQDGVSTNAVVTVNGVGTAHITATDGTFTSNIITLVVVTPVVGINLGQP